MVTPPGPGHGPDAGLLVMQLSPRLAGHLAMAVHDYRKRCVVTGTPAPLAQLDQLFQTLRWVNKGQSGSPIDPAPDVADAAPVAPRVNRPGIDGGFQPPKDGSHGGTEEVPRRAA